MFSPECVSFANSKKLQISFDVELVEAESLNVATGMPQTIFFHLITYPTLSYTAWYGNTGTAFILI